MAKRIYYLGSLESERFSLVRECRFLEEVRIGEKPAVVVDLFPGVVGQEFGLGEDLHRFVLTTRFEGDDMRKIGPFPFFVFISKFRQTPESHSKTIAPDLLSIVGWGELYRTADDADKHRFDRTA